MLAGTLFYSFIPLEQLREHLTTCETIYNILQHFRVFSEE